MGGVCSSCFHVADEPDDGGSNRSISCSCFCPSCFLHKIKNNNLNLLTPTQINNTSPPNQNSSSPNLQLLPPSASRANDGAVGGGIHHEGERGREEGGVRLSQIHPEPAGQINNVVNKKSRQETVVSPNEGILHAQNSNSSAKSLSSRVEDCIHIIPSSDDEEECPTCLEEYDFENPKITAKCAHHYHLSCIYEWKERSENCPVCGKLMEFDEEAELG